MANHHLPLHKLKTIHRFHLEGSVNKLQAAAALKISRNTLKKYLHLCDKLFKQDNSGSGNVDLLLKHLAHPPKASPQYLDLKNALPALIANHTDAGFSVKIIWQRYSRLFPQGYRYSQFARYFSDWRNTNAGYLSHHRQHYQIKEIDLPILQHWRRSSDRRKWERAVALIETAQGKSLAHIAAQIERSTDKVQEWLKDYRVSGFAGLKKKPYRKNPRMTADIKNRTDNLMALLHEAPKLHDINRTTWRLKDLSATYFKLYGQTLSMTTIAKYIKDQGFVYRKAREVLTSPDPHFKEKLEHITSILSNLKQDEKFFSVDEYGPFAVKMKGGLSLVKHGEQRTYPQLQKSKGCIICTAALELSQNQVTHFYSTGKNTDEMIRLIDLLLFRYRNESKLYISWDAASWHGSRKLNRYIEAVNSPKYRAICHTPLVELAPLPASAQFLNVIESVFSGLAKAIIHNSDYQSADECKAAIDLYFEQRNAYFTRYPKRAGKKIWGQERVKPVFDQANNCKDPSFT